MSIQSLAAGVSESAPESGQKNRSGPNFQFLKVPSSGNVTTTITGANGSSGITATLMHDIGGGNDEVVASISQNGSFDASKVQTGNYNYYVASPDGASSNFVVYFNGNV